VPPPIEAGLTVGHESCFDLGTMREIRRILCAVDLLKPALAALRHAVWLAGIFKTTQLDLVNVSLAVSGRQGMSSSNARRVEQIMMEHNGRERLDRLLQGVAEDIVARTTSHILHGKPLSAILAHAEVSNADLIVLGVGQNWAFTRFVLVGLAEQIVHGTSSPVLTAREGARAPGSSGKILVPVDFSPCTDIAFEWAAALAERLGSRLELLHVSTDRRSGGVPRQLAELAQRARSRGVAASAVMRAGGSTSAHILALAASEAYDLIVMGLHSDGDGIRVSGSGVGCAVRLRSSIPVLSVRASDPQLTLHADDLLHEPSPECSMSAVQSQAVVPESCPPH
jgi:nucleotide-binding universal stress UspA family protein